jgi:hypothetical protein
MEVEAVDDGKELIGHELCMWLMVSCQEANEPGLVDGSTHHNRETGYCLQDGQMLEGLKGHGERLGQSHVGKDKQSRGRALHSRNRTSSHGGIALYLWQ